MRTNLAQIGAARRVAVVIPHYRSDLTASERVSLQQCLKVLHRHPLILIKPDSLDAEPLLQDHPELSVESFPDPCFAGVAGYNDLMLSDHFYARFAAYEYILIHQLDAFVFSDQLDDWCARGYDYVGAPWLREKGLRGRVDRYRVLAKQQLFRWLNTKDRDGRANHTGQINYGVGNGGFSLRRVAAMRQVLAALQDRVQPYRAAAGHTYNEDVFFGVEANRYRRRLRIPGYAVAAGFAWEFAPAQARRLTQGQLPFGCHGWDRFHRDVWRPVFAEFGVDLDAVLGVQAA